MNVSDNGIALIKYYEGLELQAYQDIAGVWTIGYGHTETAAPGQVISEASAEELLRADLKPRKKALLRLVTVPLNQNEFDGLTSFIFNIGEGNFKKSTCRRRLNAGDRIGAYDAMLWFNKATVNGKLVEVKGLTRRRYAERVLCLTPVEDDEPVNYRESNVCPDRETPPLGFVQKVLPCLV